VARLQALSTDWTFPRAEQQVVRLVAESGEAHEEGRDVAVEADRHAFNVATEVSQAGAGSNSYARFDFWKAHRRFKA